MTREEAVEKLEAFAPMVVDDTREALDMAIEALSAETHEIRTETHGVCLINRQDAIEAICDVVINEFDVCPTCGYDVAEKALSALPKVLDIAIVKRGTWQYYVKGNDAWAVCSECGKVSIVGGNYCPNCGAKMKGTEE